MFGPMMNSNLVFVPLIRSKIFLMIPIANISEIIYLSEGFLRSEFDTTYPMRLNGIINQEEYQNSILNINRALKPDQSSTICVIITAMISFIGIICLMLFGFVVASSHHQNAFLLLSIFLGIAFLGSLGLLISLFNFQSKRVSRMHQAITQESAKYCKKTPIPCSWRSTHPSTTFGNSHSSSGVCSFFSLCRTPNK